MRHKHVLIDARELAGGKQTGIGRFLEGLLPVVSKSLPMLKITMASSRRSALPGGMIYHENLEWRLLPNDFIRSELVISRLSRTGFDLLISPYPKLPAFGIGCPSIHTVHDVIDLRGRFQSRCFRRFFDRWRLKSALKKAALTWYVSSWSMQETLKLLGTAGGNPKIRPNGIDDRFEAATDGTDSAIRAMYGLDSGYVLALGNGKPHKNLAVLVDLANRIHRVVVLAGVSKRRRQYWTNGQATPNIRWFEHLPDRHLPAIVRGSFCLALPSLIEGYGYPPLEAMACGIPAVVSDIPVLRETTGGNAAYADPRTWVGWLEALTALENSQFYHRQSQRGLHWVRQFKGERAWHKHLADIYGLLAQNNMN
jgi:glycosyltransferase involved in cell wall biosynthesis